MSVNTRKKKERRYMQMRGIPGAGKYRFNKATSDSVMFKYDIFTISFKGVP